MTQILHTFPVAELLRLCELQDLKYVILRIEAAYEITETCVKCHNVMHIIHIM